MGRIIIEDDDVKQGTLDMELPAELPETNNYQKTECEIALHKFIDAYGDYLECKDKYDYKKATLQTKTDWSVALEGINRPTVADKESYITEVMFDKTRVLHEKYLEKRFREELYKIELLKLEKD